MRHRPPSLHPGENTRQSTRTCALWPCGLRRLRALVVGEGGLVLVVHYCTMFYSKRIPPIRLVYSFSLTVDFDSLLRALGRGGGPFLARCLSGCETSLDAGPVNWLVYAGWRYHYGNFLRIWSCVGGCRWARSSHWGRRRHAGSRSRTMFNQLACWDNSGNS